MQTPMETAGQAVSAFWHKVRASRRRDLPSSPGSPRGAMHESTGSRHDLPIQTEHRADSPRRPCRLVLSAEDLVDNYINSLVRGDYAFRMLKGEFDELCADAAIAPVSDKQLAHWLLARGHRKWREGGEKVTMYRIAPARRARATRDRPAHAAVREPAGLCPA
jgi:hypothetical protein